MSIYTGAEGAVFLYHLPKKPPRKALPQPQAGSAPCPARAQRKDPAAAGTMGSPVLSQTKPTTFPQRRGGTSPGDQQHLVPVCPQHSVRRGGGQGDRHCTIALVAFTMVVAGAASSTSASYVPTTNPTKPKRLMAMSLAMTRGCMPSA